MSLSARMKLGRFIFLLVYIGKRVWGYETLVAHKLHAVHRGEIIRHACRSISNLGFVD